MRAMYLQRREPFDEILVRTLNEGWRSQYGDGIRVSLRGPADAGKSWLLQPLLNGYYVPDTGPAVRTFLRDNFRHTLVRRRAAAQWILGTLLAHPVGLRLTGRPAFVVDGTIPFERDLLVMPGSQRIRVFDFERGRSRVMLKNGFDGAPMRREIEVRGRGDGPFPQLMDWSEDGSFFEEPILDAVPLARMSSRKDFDRFEREAIETLEQWLLRSRTYITVDERLEFLVPSVKHNLDMLAGRLHEKWRARVSRWAARLADASRTLGTIPVAEAHGDLMRDNIMIDRKKSSVILIDWERCRRRYFWYDRLVYSLDSRFPAGLGERFRAFIADPASHWAWLNLPLDISWRRGALALFVLEDLVGNLHVNASNPIYAVAEDFQIYLSEMASLGNTLDGLFGTQASPERRRRSASGRRHRRSHR